MPDAFARSFSLGSNEENQPFITETSKALPHSKGLHGVPLAAERCWDGALIQLLRHGPGGHSGDFHLAKERPQRLRTSLISRPKDMTLE